MNVISLFMDECLDQDIAWLTGIFVPAQQHADVRDAVVRLTQAVILSLKPGYPPPLELHGSSMLAGVPEATDEHRLRVFEEVVAL